MAEPGLAVSWSVLWTSASPTSLYLPELGLPSPSPQARLNAGAQLPPFTFGPRGAILLWTMSAFEQQALENLPGRP